MLSVLIATKNRSQAIGQIALPSLLAQTKGGFEIVIWDASDNDETEKIVDRMRTDFLAKDIYLQYTRAPRSGLASQRNDAVKKAKGEVVFFIDDDSEISSDAVAVLGRYFQDFKWLQGAALPLLDKTRRIEKYIKHPVLGIFRNVMDFFMRGPDSNFRKIKSSTKNSLPSHDIPGKAEWLTGADMAFRKSVFNDLCFDERLETFGGYALGEDSDFSHRVFLKYGEPLLITSSGFVVHHNFGGKRIANPRKMAASIFYNTALIRHNFNQYLPYRCLPFIWEMRVVQIITLIMQRYRLKDIILGYFDYKNFRK